MKPIVAVVGRPNVGKSMLVNRIMMQLELAQPGTDAGQSAALGAHDTGHPLA